MKLSFFIPVLLFFSLNCAFGQVDSLTTKSFEELEKLYLEFIYTSPKKAKVYADALYNVTLKGTDKQRIAKALYRKGYIYSSIDSIQKALVFLDNSIEISHQIDYQELLMQNFSKKGNIYLAKGDYDKAIIFYFKAKKIAEKAKNTRDILVMDTNIALVKKQTGDYTGAINDFKKNLKKIKELNTPIYDRLEVGNNVALGDTYLRISNPDSASFYTKKGFLKSSPKMYPILYTELSLNNVVIHFQKKQYQQCIDLAVSLHTLIKKTEQPKKFVTSYLYQAKSYNALQLRGSAIFQYEKIKNLSKQEDFIFPELEKVYYQLAKMYLEEEDLENTALNLELFEKFKLEKDSTNTSVHHKIQDYDISTLRKKLQNVINERAKQRKMMRYLYIISGVLVVFAILFFLLYKKNKKHSKERFNELLVEIQQLESQKKKPKVTPQKTDLAINDEGVEQILKDLAKFEAKQQYLHVDCTLAYTAKKLKTNTAYLSHVINTYKGKKFTAYLNELRINTALVTLKNDKKIRLYSIKAIANEFGYARRETFSKVFKSATGMDPTSYIKELQLKDKNSGDNS